MPNDGGPTIILPLEPLDSFNFNGWVDGKGEINVTVDQKGNDD